MSPQTCIEVPTLPTSLSRRKRKFLHLKHHQGAPGMKMVTIHLLAAGLSRQARHRHKDADSVEPAATSVKGNGKPKGDPECLSKCAWKLARHPNHGVGACQAWMAAPRHLWTGTTTVGASAMSETGQRGKLQWIKQQRCSHRWHPPTAVAAGCRFSARCAHTPLGAPPP